MQSQNIAVHKKNKNSCEFLLSLFCLWNFNFVITIKSLVIGKILMLKAQESIGDLMITFTTKRQNSNLHFSEAHMKDMWL